MNLDETIKTLLHTCDQVYTEAELRHKLSQAAHAGRPLRVKLGMDPTAPDIHIGHVVVLQKLRAFQDLGHTAVLIIGDFTARIGDPTGRSKTRPVLSDADIDANARTYFDQAGKVLDLAPDKLEVRRNSEWLGAMRFDDVLRLAGRMTVGQMLKREDFRNRYESETPISIHELLYPLVQGWDSVNIHADVELGGTDQTYNNLVGRELQSQVGQHPQVVMTFPLLRGLDGQKKMSKSLGNYIGVAENPRDMFGKTMSIPDELMPDWYRLLTDIPATTWQAQVRDDPMGAKQALAVAIGSRFHSTSEMNAAADWWREHFGSRQAVAHVPLSIPATELENGGAPAWKLAWLAHQRAISKSEARRMVENGAFAVGDEKITDPTTIIPVANGLVFRAGRHRSGERIKQPLINEVTIE